MPDSDSHRSSSSAGRANASEFRAAFQDEVAPLLPGLEALRLRRLARLKTETVLILAGCAAVGAVPLVIGSPSVLQIAVLMVGALIGGLIIAWQNYRWAATGFVDRVTEAIMPAICGFIGDLSYRRDPYHHADATRFLRLRVVERFSSAELKDEFEGRHRGTAFRMLKASQPSWDGNQPAFGFAGVMLTIDVPVPFSGTILLTGGRGQSFSRIASFAAAGQDLQTVTFDDLPFDSIFEVSAEDPAEARKLLVPRLRETLIELDRLTGGLAPDRSLRAAFDAGEFLLAIPRRSDAFDIGDLHRPVDGIESEMERLLTEVTIPHRVIDYLSGNHPDGA